MGTLGTALIGIGVVPQLNGGTPSKLLTYTAVVGFFISAVGKFFTALFAADARVVADLGTAVAQNTAALKTGDTSILNKTDVVKT